MNHRITIIRDPSDGWACLICSCGFNARVSSQEYEDLSALASNHTAPISVPPPVDLRQFVSGLPERQW